MLCERCGQPYTPRTVTVLGGPGRPQRFCSWLCASAARQARLRAANPEKYRTQRAARAKLLTERGRRARLLSRFGIIPEQYDELLASQNGVCAICGQPEKATRSGRIKALAVDHDHTCCAARESCGKCIRGLLCSGCNGMLGHALDSQVILAAAIEYLNRRHRG